MTDVTSVLLLSLTWLWTPWGERMSIYSHLIPSASTVPAPSRPLITSCWMNESMNEWKMKMMMLFRTTSAAFKLGLLPDFPESSSFQESQMKINQLLGQCPHRTQTLPAHVTRVCRTCTCLHLIPADNFLVSYLPPLSQEDTFTLTSVELKLLMIKSRTQQLKAVSK